jgi:hypothetical protein
MILKVLDVQGQVIHDCRKDGCTASWDGYAIKSGLKITGQVDVLGQSVADVTLALGAPLPGRGDPDASVWAVANGVARLKQQNG